MNIDIGKSPLDIAALIGDTIAFLGNGVALFVFFRKNRIDNKRISKSIQRETRNALIVACDKVYRYTILWEKSRLRLAMYKEIIDINNISITEKHELENQYELERITCNNLEETRYLLKGDLHKNLYDLNEQKNKEIIKNNLINFEKLDQTDIEFGSNINPKYEELNKAIPENVKKIKGYVLIQIINLLNPENEEYIKATYND